MLLFLQKPLKNDLKRSIYIDDSAREVYTEYTKDSYSFPERKKDATCMRLGNDISQTLGYTTWGRDIVQKRVTSGMNIDYEQRLVMNWPGIQHPQHWWKKGQQSLRFLLLSFPYGHESSQKKAIWPTTSKMYAFAKNENWAPKRHEDKKTLSRETRSFLFAFFRFGPATPAC